jgi:predicted RNase H-like nuclease (RuvC/YqgF family)
MNNWIDAFVLGIAGVAGGVITMIARAFIDRKKIVEEVGTAAAQRIESEISILSKITEENRKRLTSMYETQIEEFEKKMSEKDVECGKKIDKQAKEIAEIKKANISLNNKYNELKQKYNGLVKQMIEDSKK